MLVHVLQDLIAQGVETAFTSIIWPFLSVLQLL